MTIFKEPRSVFHAGERAVQARAAVSEDYVDMVSRAIRSAMPDQHRRFFASLPVLFIGLTDQAGRVWSVPVFGAPGFLTSPRADRLVVDGKPPLTDILKLDVSAGAKVGAIGLQLTTRRRNRLNGTLLESDEGLLVAVDQSFGNCPQYIQTREIDWQEQDHLKPMAVKLDSLTSDAKALISQADTFFIASRSKELTSDPRAGVDASHRGGKPGFLGINDDESLSFPDFSGNKFFNTLGNIEEDGRVGLFVPNFETGAALVLTGRGKVDWSQDRVSAFAGAERIIDVIPDEVWLVEQALPGHGQLLDRWPALDQTGSWQGEPAS
ncbi:pyridoxamine 5'-phosphate oxidase family protein [Cohaesibacter sp. CAU 1516]|uniref:pyridoxamine 5'-phosphate oxidase family protein n=1 Tax=Cohaesibacter sp. CAU 1516 TaxID=2576038 RepID=UPI001AEF3104|nr:pyridoxamine 5'-phosphate oxidase family protein [Cohaesibacter sp. CAU 1516]